MCVAVCAGKRSSKAPRISAKLDCRDEFCPLKSRRPGALRCLAIQPWFDSRCSGKAQQASFNRRAAQTCPGRVTWQPTSDHQLRRSSGFLLLRSVPPIKGACSPADVAAGLDKLCQKPKPKTIVLVKRRGKSRSYALFARAGRANTTRLCCARV